METILSAFYDTGKTHHLVLLSSATDEIKKENNGICLLHVHGLQQCCLLTKQP
jgi:hypothetical protein